MIIKIVAKDLMVLRVLFERQQFAQGTTRLGLIRLSIFGKWFFYAWMKLARTASI